MPYYIVGNGQVGSGDINEALVAIQSQDFINYTNASTALAAGDVVVINDIVGVADEAIANGATGRVSIGGVRTLPKEAVTINQGAKVNWNASSELATTSVTSNYVGIAIAQAATIATSVRVRLAGAGT